MKKITKRKLAVGIAVSLLGGILSACAKTDTSSGNSAQESSDISVNETVEATDNREEGKETVKIEFMQNKLEAVASWEALVAKFEEEYPYIDIELVTPAEYFSVLSTRIAQNDAPDIFTHLPLRADFDEVRSSGIVMPITDQAFLENVNDQVMEWSVKEDGEIYSLPFTLNTMGMYYNNEIMEKYNLEIPETYEELIALLEQVKDEPDGTYIVSYGEAATIWQTVDRRLGQLFANSGNSFTEAFESIASGEISSKDCPEFVAAIDKVMELFQYAQDDPFAPNAGQASTDFANGLGVAMFGGTWFYPSIVAANPDMDFTFTPFPADEGEISYLSTNVDIGLSITNTCEHPEEALIFLEYCAQPENAQYFSDRDGSLSCIKGVTNSIPMFDEAYTEINAGNAYKMAATEWPAGYNDSVAEMVGALLLNNDYDSFYKEVDAQTAKYYGY